MQHVLAVEALERYGLPRLKRELPARLDQLAQERRYKHLAATSLRADSGRHRDVLSLDGP